MENDVGEEELLDEITKGDESAQVKKAASLLIERSAGKVRSCGKPYYLHPLRVAAILSQGNMDRQAVIAAVLHSAPDIGITEEEIALSFGEDVLHLVKGVYRIKNLSLRASHGTLIQADAVRKMLFAMVDDVRIILIKMADRLDRIRNIRNMEVRHQRELSQEIIDIWAPLADRLGMQAEKNEFEDLSLKYSNPDVFAQIKAIVSQKKSERDAYLEKAVALIKNEAIAAGIECKIKSRAKHFYSIYQKMRKRGKEASCLFDLFAIRIICKKKSDCYTLLGIVHGLWKPLEGRFKDYIAMPKANGYSSLHTTVMCQAGEADIGGGEKEGEGGGTEDGSEALKRPLEIQIRTEDMDNMAEHGLASHWLYKKGTNHDLVDVSSLAIFNELKQWRHEIATDKEAAASSYPLSSTFDRLKRDLLGDEIYVFTPKGEVISLPEGSCAIDFAYRIHSSIGEKIVGAKADGKIIPLLEPLHNTQIIEVLTDPRAHPTQTQLKACRTSKARQKIHAYLVANGYMESDDKKIHHQDNAVKKTSSEEYQKKQDITPKKNEKNSNIKADVTIEGEGGYLHCFAKCCRPVKGDAIVGFISRSRGIVIHRASCLVYQRIQDREKRTVKVEWV